MHLRWSNLEQLVAIVAVCRLAILKRIPTTPLTLMVAHIRCGNKWKCKWQIYETLHGLSEEEVKSQCQRKTCTVVKSWEKCMGCCWGCLFKLTTPQCHGGILHHFWSTDRKITFSTPVSTWKSILESPTMKKYPCPGHGYFSKLVLHLTVVGRFACLGDPGSYLTWDCSPW